MWRSWKLLDMIVHMRCIPHKFRRNGFKFMFKIGRNLGDKSIIKLSQTDRSFISISLTIYNQSI